MGKPITIALDAMGGDHGPQVTVPAALKSLKEERDIKVILVGDKDAITEQLSLMHILVKGKINSLM